MINRHRQRFGVAAIVAAMSWHATAFAYDGAAGSLPATLTLTVEGRVTRVPDVAEVSGGVVTTAPTAAAAMADNAARMSAVVAAVRKSGVAERDIQTAGLSLQPQYKYDNNLPPVLSGYQATNTVNVRIRKVGDTGKLLDALARVGANQMNGPAFRIEDSETALDEARLAAVKTARVRAELYAKATGLHIKRLITLSENTAMDSAPRPMMMKMARAADTMETPVMPGEVALTITLTAVFEFE
jgi:hypothetical protein